MINLASGADLDVLELVEEEDEGTDGEGEEDEEEEEKRGGEKDDNEDDDDDDDSDEDGEHARSSRSQSDESAESKEGGGGQFRSDTKRNEEKVEGDRRNRPPRITVPDKLAKPLPKIPITAMGNLDEIRDEVQRFADTWQSKLEAMSEGVRDTEEARKITELTNWIVKVCERGSSSSPKRVTGKSLNSIQNSFAHFKTKLDESMSVLMTKAKDSSDRDATSILKDIRSRFRNLTSHVEKVAKRVWEDPVVSSAMKKAKKSVGKVMGKKRLHSMGRHIRKISTSLMNGINVATSKGNMAMQTVLAASKLQAFEHKIKTRYHKVKRDVKQTLLAHMEASVRDLALIQQGGNVAANLKSYDFIPFVVTPILLSLIKYSTLINLVAAILYTLIILCLLAFDSEDACDDGIQFWFGFKMCLETMSAICLFWTLMLVRAWEKRYEASFAMAESRGNDMMDAGKGEESNEVIQFKIDHMIHQGKDSLETFRAVTNSVSWYCIKLLVLITVFYDIGAIYMANARHCAECGATVIEFGVYVWSFWIVTTLMYRCGIIVWNIWFLCLKCQCCRKKVLASADGWDEYIGIGICSYLCQKVLFLDILPSTSRSSAQAKKIKKLMKEQMNALQRYNDIENKIRKLKLEIRQNERKAVFSGEVKQNDAQSSPLHSPNSPAARGMAGKVGLTQRELGEFSSVMNRANETILEEFEGVSGRSAFDAKRGDKKLMAKRRVDRKNI